MAVISRCFSCTGRSDNSIAGCSYVYDILSDIQCLTVLIHCLLSDLMGAGIAAKTHSDSKL